MSDRLEILGRGLRRERAAAYVGVSAGTFDDLVRRGQLPRPRLLADGRVKVWDRADLDAVLETGVDWVAIATGWEDV
ncbi:MAG: helix-turn-helix transcriptional regulator [Alphaproteobacteria bacterium]